MHGDTPLRGTQSLVGVMGFVWRHPALTLLELLWRWIAAAPLFWLGWHALAPAFAPIPVDQAALDTMTFLEPVRSARVLSQQLSPFVPPLLHTLRWLGPLALIVWSVAATLGRTAVLCRADRSLRAAYAPIALATFLRALCFAALLGLWLAGLFAAVQSTVIGPGRRGAEPSIVLLTANAVVLTLAAFVLWSLTIWALDLVPLKPMSGCFPATVPQRRELRSKLMETNLVMGIVRVALLVLTMTFSASPLPFQTKETQSFIDVWWVITALFYILSSDFFHVVRRVTYLRLLQNIAKDRV